jgi:nucleotide-binding universal stress UspA family protein
MRVPVKKILVPTDFSEASRDATMTANDLALAFEAELILLHVVRGIPPFPGNMGSAAAVFNTDTYQKNLRAYRSQELEAFARQFREGERRLRTIVRDGDPERSIVEIADEEGVDLLVVSTQGRTGLNRFVFGSVAEKVVRHSPCPVLVLPPEKQGASEEG